MTVGALFFRVSVFTFRIGEDKVFDRAVIRMADETKLFRVLAEKVAVLSLMVRRFGILHRTAHHTDGVPLNAVHPALLRRELVIDGVDVVTDKAVDAFGKHIVFNRRVNRAVFVQTHQDVDLVVDVCRCDSHARIVAGGAKYFDRIDGITGFAGIKIHRFTQVLVVIVMRMRMIRSRPLFHDVGMTGLAFARIVVFYIEFRSGFGSKKRHSEARHRQQSSGKQFHVLNPFL